MRNSRLRSSPNRGRSSSRYFQLIWYRFTGQIAVGRVLLRDDRRHDLLCGRRQAEAGLLAVEQPEHERPVLRVASGALPQLERLQDRQHDLLRTGAVHLLAHDLLDLAQHPGAERQPGVDAGRDPADVAGTNEQTMAVDLGIGGVVAQRAQEQRGHAHPSTVLKACACPSDYGDSSHPRVPPLPRRHTRRVGRSGVGDQREVERQVTAGAVVLVDLDRDRVRAVHEDVRRDREVERTAGPAAALTFVEANVADVIVPVGMFERATSVPLMYTTAPSSRTRCIRSDCTDAALATLNVRPEVRGDVLLGRVRHRSRPWSPRHRGRSRAAPDRLPTSSR